MLCHLRAEAAANSDCCMDVADVCYWLTLGYAVVTWCKEVVPQAKIFPAEGLTQKE